MVCQESNTIFDSFAKAKLFFYLSEYIIGLRDMLGSTLEFRIQNHINSDQI